MKTTSEIQKVKINDRREPYRWITVQHYYGQKLICQYGLADIRLSDFLSDYLNIVSTRRVGHLNFMFFDIRNQPYKNLHVRVSSCVEYLNELKEKRICL